MSRLSRLALRLRRRVLRAYELTLYAVLVALALALALPAASTEADDAAAQCGNIHSSAVVIMK